jgi:hypothetical protein
MNKMKTVFMVGVVGGFVGYACGAAFTPTRASAQQVGAEDAGPPAQVAQEDAGASTVPPAPNQAGSVPQPACRQWEVKIDPRFTYPSSGILLMDEGWEPFAYYGGGGTIALRRCVR